jgi:hypothetical protein
MMTNDDAFTPDYAAVTNKYECLCGRKYKYRQGLWKHKKNCKNTKIPESSSPEMIINEHTEIKVLTELVKDVIKQNQDLTNKIVDICKSGQTNNISHSNIHSNNKTFNLQFFLNETCKDAMNISEFIESIKFQLTDLEHTGRAGFVEGISNVVLNNLKDLDTRQRPIHCSDNKREILYIKDNNEWKKEDDNKTELTKAIKTIGKKNMMQIFEWQKKHPEYNDPDSKENDKYQKMIMNAMSGSTTEEQENNMKKIIKNVTKNVVIDKDL